MNETSLSDLKNDEITKKNVKMHTLKDLEYKREN